MKIRKITSVEMAEINNSLNLIKDRILEIEKKISDEKIQSLGCPTLPKNIDVQSE